MLKPPILHSWFILSLHLSYFDEGYGNTEIVDEVERLPEYRQMIHRNENKSEEEKLAQKVKEEAETVKRIRNALAQHAGQIAYRLHRDVTP